ncbi:MAG: hypothetical protein K1X89_17720 [Myxococcaceae bacterium]|nr:hypothetical protein [Myxococcaceae bacterium]
MRGSVPETLAWRLSLHDGALGLCRQGGFPLGRFLALVVDSLERWQGTSLANARVAVGFPAAARQAIAAALPPERAELRGPLDDASLRRALRLAQVAGAIEPLAAGAWVQGAADRLLQAVGALTARVLEEAPKSRSGEATAYLVQLSLVRAFREALEGFPPGACALVSAGLSLALEGALAALPKAAAPSGRLGFQFALASSPLCLGATVGDFVGRPLNAYRTLDCAVTLAKARWPQAVESLNPRALAAQVAEGLLARPDFKQQLLEEALSDVVRDAAMLFVLRAGNTGHAQLPLALRRLSGQARYLHEGVTDRVRRDELVQLLDGYPGAATPPLPALRKLLTNAERTLLGHPELLGPYGDLKARAQLAATGAVVLLLDEQVAFAVQAAQSRIDVVKDAQVDASFTAGRCYRLAFDARPLLTAKVELPRDAIVAVEVPAPEQLGGIEALDGRFLTPLLEALRRHAPSPEHLSLVSLAPGAALFRGHPECALSLAAEARRIADRATLAPGEESAGHDGQRLAEVKAELEGAAQALTALGADGALRDPVEWQRLSTRRELLAESAAALERRQGVAASLAVAVVLGPKVEPVRAGDAALPTSPGLGAALAGLQHGVARPAGAFRVRVDRVNTLELPGSEVTALGDAIAREDRVAATAAVRALAQWVHKETTDRIDRKDPRLPDAFGTRARLENHGLAVSAEVLDALWKALGSEVHQDQRELYRSQLPAALASRFPPEQDPERYWAAWRGRHLAFLFRYTGPANLGAQTVELWEWVDPQGELAQALDPLLVRSTR